MQSKITYYNYINVYNGFLVERVHKCSSVCVSWVSVWLRSPAKQVPYISTTIKRELNNRNSVT